MSVPAIARPTGEAGVSTISSAAGRNSRSARVAPLASGTTLLAARHGMRSLQPTSWSPACMRCSVA